MLDRVVLLLFLLSSVFCYGDTFYILTDTLADGKNYLISDSYVAGDTHLFSRTGSSHSATNATIEVEDIDLDGKEETFISATDSSSIWTATTQSNGFGFLNDTFNLYCTTQSDHILITPYASTSSYWSYSAPSLIFHYSSSLSYFLYYSDSTFTGANTNGTDRKIYLFVETDVKICPHEFSITEITSPTCTSDSAILYTCDLCHKEKREIIQPAFGHDLSSIHTDATDYTDGFTTYTCRRCDTCFTKVDADYLFIASDRHDNATVIGDLLHIINNDGITPSAVLLLGDMVGSGTFNPVYFSSSILSEITNHIDSCYTLILYGNHDENCSDDSGILHTSCQAIDFGDYYLYTLPQNLFNTTEYADTFKLWIDTLSDTRKPIFVLSHLSIHYKRSDDNGNTNAFYWHDALNYAATDGRNDSIIRRNVFFFHGHNHSLDINEYYYPAGGSMPILGEGSYPNYYTYATAGYLNANHTATLVTLTNTSVYMEKYHAEEGLHNSYANDGGDSRTKQTIHIQRATQSDLLSIIPLSGNKTPRLFQTERTIFFENVHSPIIIYNPQGKIIYFERYPNSPWHFELKKTGTYILLANNDVYRFIVH